MQNIRNPLAGEGISDCWNHIGVYGNSSCSELAVVNHCRNCPVYKEAAHGLLQRAISEGYREEWASILQGEKKKAKTETLSVVIFRIGEEWFALRTNCFREVSATSKVHRLPHRKDSVLVGLVNIRGEIQLCAALPRLLQMPARTFDSSESPRRLMTVEMSGERWVFRVDEVRSTVRIDPVQVKQSEAAGLRKGTFQWQENEVSYLDEEMLFSILKRSVS